MLEVVDGNRFGAEASGGTTLPSRMGCTRRDGSPIDVYVKCSWKQCPPGGLIREVVGCLLAQRLGLSVGEPVLVKLPEDLTSGLKRIDPSRARRFECSVHPVFGSVALGSGFMLCHRVDRNSPPQIQAAFDIWAFDQLINNSDRNARKPNCLIREDVVAVIDHEKSLVMHGVGTLFSAPWQDGWRSDVGHLFHDIVINEDSRIGQMRGQWDLLTVDDIDEILSAVPDSWVKDDKDDVMASIREYLIELHQNRNAVFDNLERVVR